MPHTTPNPKKFKDIKALIFDWSGVISDDRLPVYEANKVVMEKHGVAHESFENWLLHTTASAPLYFASRGITADPAVLMEEYRTALQGSKERAIHPVIYPDAAATLKTLAASKKLFVVSMHPHDHLQKEAYAYGVQEYLSGILGEVKDKATAIEGILKSSELAPLSVLYVGDTIFDIQAAKRAGVASVGISTGYQTHDVLVAEHPDLVIAKFSDLLTYL